MTSTLSPMDRRRFIRGAALAAAGAIASPRALAALDAPRTARGELRPTSPDDALTLLLEGNARFVADEGTGLHRDIARVRSLAEGQSPFAAVLSCADSRVPPELLFDQGFGDLFTVRVAGNVAGTEEVASLEYSVGVLGSVLVLVLGHTGCGAVTAAMQAEAVPGRISALFSHITPAVADVGDDVNAGVVANVRHQARVLRTSSPVLRAAVDGGTVRIVGGVYDLETGAVRIVEV